MVDPGATGRGVGRALGDYVVAWARREGYHGIQFNAVVETNAAAMHLWQSLGFEVLGTVPEAFEHRTFGRVGLNILYKKI
jgi:GNAT superfamily N-acetyltransferase